jgi:class 3 adenylate cyclase
MLTSLMDVTCPNCGQPNPESNRFCGRCGHALNRMAPAGGEERKVVTVLFADVVGSTSLGERLDAERLRDVMGSFFAAMREEIEAEGGTVEKFIGDAVMAVFGVPQAHEDDPARTLRASLRMRERLDALNVDLEETHGVGLAIRVGVNTGEVIAAAAARHGEGMVSGDPVNVAARLEQVAAPGSIVVSERTARATRGFSFRRLGPLELKGKERGVSAVELLGGTGAGLTRGVPGLTAPMVGRDEELGLLRSIYRRAAADGRPHLVTAFGDAGIGKSRLVSEFVSLVESSDQPALVLRGRCLPYGEGITYWPLAEILKGHAGVLDTDPPEMTVEKVRKVGADLFTPDLATDPLRATALIAYTIGVEDPEFDIASLPPRQVKQELHAAWRSFFSALAAAGPIVVIVEDIHWADPAMLDLLEELADRVQGPAVFMCPSRPELMATRPGWGGGRRSYSSIFLEPLSEHDAQGLVETLLTVEDLPDPVRERILERAEGNPFYLEEIIRGLIDSGLITHEEGRWRAVREIGDVDIPDTVQGVLAARIDLLSPADKRALQLAAVVGRIFWSELVIRLMGPNGDMTETFVRLQDRELILSRLGSTLAGQQEFIFKHILTRDVAYRSLPRRDRVGAHAQVARWIESTTGERRDEFVELVAHHYGEAYRGIREEVRADPATAERLRLSAFDALLRSSDAALCRMALAASMRAAEQADAVAIRPEEHARALEALGMACSSDYRGDEAWRILSQAADVRNADLPEDGRALARVCGRALEIPTRWPGSMRHVISMAEAERYLTMGLDACPPGDSEERVRLQLAQGFWPFAFPEARDPATLERSAAAADEAIAMSRRLGRLDLELAALDARSCVPIVQGLYGGVWPYIERRLELIRDFEDPWEVGDTYSLAAWHLFDVGHYADAARYGFEGAERAAGGVMGVGIHSLARGLGALLPMGRWDELMIRFDELQESMGDRRDEPPPFVIGAYTIAAFVHEARGEREASDRLLQVVEALRGTRGDDTIPLADPYGAATLGRRGLFDEAFARLDAHEGELANRAAWYAVRCDLSGDAERWDQADAFVATSRAWAQEAQLVALPAHADRLEGRAALAAGRAADAVALLTRARDLFAELDADWEGARTDLHLARAILAADSASAAQPDARVVAQRALEVFERIGALREAEDARDLVRQ